MGSLSGAELAGERMNVALQDQRAGGRALVLQRQHAAATCSTTRAASRTSTSDATAHVDGTGDRRASIAASRANAALDARIACSSTRASRPSRAIPGPFDQAILADDEPRQRVAIRAAIDALRAQDEGRGRRRPRALEGSDAEPRGLMRRSGSRRARTRSRLLVRMLATECGPTGYEPGEELRAATRRCSTVARRVLDLRAQPRCRRPRPVRGRQRLLQRQLGDRAVVDVGARRPRSDLQRASPAAVPLQGRPRRPPEADEEYWARCSCA